MLQDLKLALRLLLKSPAFSAVAVLTLGLGIGANTAIFSLVNAFFLAGFPVARPAELVNLYTADARNPGFLPTSQLNYRDYREQNQVFSDLACFTFAAANTMINGEPAQIFGEMVSGNYFDLLGVRAGQGRTFRPEEYEKPGTHSVVVLSHSFWKTQLAADPAILGRTLPINGTPFTIIGVAPANFKGLNSLNSPTFWVPTSSYKQVLSGLFLNFYENRRALLFSVFGRLKKDISIEQAAASLAPISSKLAELYPADNQDRTLTLVPLAESGINPGQRGNFTLIGALLLSLSGLVLLIACANLANLLLARAIARQREVAVRLALGADRTRLLRQFFTESLLLSFLGGAVGLVIASWTLDLLWSLRPPFFPADFVIALDARVLGFTLLISVVTGLLFGLAPAWSATRLALTSVLKEEGSGSAQPNPLFSFRHFLVAAQVGLSVVALIIAGLFIRSLAHTQRLNPGWNTSSLAQFSVNVSAQGYSTPAALAYHRRALERVLALPGVTGATIASTPMLSGGGPLRTLRPQGNDDKLRNSGQLVDYNQIWPGFFRTLGIPLVAGRDFTDQDDATHPPVVIINEHLAKLAWPGESAIGKTLKVYGSENPVEVVGVAKTIVTDNIGEQPKPYSYFPMQQESERLGFATLHIRTQAPALTQIPLLRRELQALDPALPFVNVTTVEDNIRQGLWAPRAGAAMLSAFGLLALLLASLGVYSIMAYTVGRRTREIGIRMAIGANSADVLKLVLLRGIQVTGAGLVAGLLLAFGLTRYFQNLLLGVSASDPLTYAAIALLLAAVALVACWLPARRATKVNPLVALRAE